MELRVIEVSFNVPQALGPMSPMRDQVQSVSASDSVELLEHRTGILMRTGGNERVQVFPWAAIASYQAIEVETKKAGAK